MQYDPPSQDESLDTNPRRLSENGQMAAIGIYGFLVLVGFFFGVVTGYEKPRVIVKKETVPATPTKFVADPPKKNPKDTLDKTKDDTKTDDEVKKEEPKKEEMKKDDPETKVEPKKEEPKKEEPKKEEPKKEEPKTEIVGKAPAFKEVQAILLRHCGTCHGTTGKPKDDVDVSTYDKLMKSPSGIGKAIVAGDLKKSGVLQSILGGSMPPDGKPKPTQKEIETLQNWILAGAKPRRRRFVK